MTPWLLLVLMPLSVYRLTRLLVDDTFPPVLWLRDRVIGGWRPLTMKEQQLVDFHWENEGQSASHDVLGSLLLTDGVVNRYMIRSRRVPLFFAGLLSCPYCTSGWVGMAVAGGVWWWLGLAVPLVVLLWLASWALGGLLAAQEWS
jgi:hypothetical protein